MIVAASAGAPKLLDRFAGTSRALSAMRAPMVMATCASRGRWAPEQGRAGCRVRGERSRETRAAGRQWQWLMAAASLLLLAVVFWQAARELTHLVSQDQDLDREPI